MTEPVWLHPWAADDQAVLERNNTPEMTIYLGGPESDEQIMRRQANYLRLWQEGEARMFTVWVPSEGVAVGSVGYWTTTWSGIDVYETGWSIATPYQGRGIATRALRACLEYAAAHGDRDEVFAFPRIDNGASNALCRSVGFRFRTKENFEYPKGHPIRVNTWSFDLVPLRHRLTN